MVSAPVDLCAIHLARSRQRAFEGLDRGNKGFLTAEDVRGDASLA